MIEHLMSSSLSGDHQGCAAGFIRLHVRGLRSHQSLIARAVVCATGAVHTDIFRSIRYLPNPVPGRWCWHGTTQYSLSRRSSTPVYCIGFSAPVDGLPLRVKDVASPRAL